MIVCFYRLSWASINLTTGRRARSWRAGPWGKPNVLVSPLLAGRIVLARRCWGDWRLLRVRVGAFGYGALSFLGVRRPCMGPAENTSSQWKQLGRQQLVCIYVQTISIELRAILKQQQNIPPKACNMYQSCSLLPNSSKSYPIGWRTGKQHWQEDSTKPAT